LIAAYSGVAGNLLEFASNMVLARNLKPFLNHGEHRGTPAHSPPFSKLEVSVFFASLR